MGEPWAQERIILRNLLKVVRREHGVLQKELAVRLCKPQSYVSKVESSEQRMDIVELREWCMACGTDLLSFVQRFESEVSKLQTKGL